MSEETKQSSGSEPQAAASPPRKSKKVVLTGGSVGLILLIAWVLSLVAVPHKAEDQHLLNGPYVVELSPKTGFQVNLAGRGGRHYLALSIKAEVDVFEESYAAALAETPLYQARVTDTVLDLTSRKGKEDIEDKVGKEILREELRIALDPVLFAVHVGNAEHVDRRDEESGLRPGASNRQATLRGMFYEHELELDAAERTIRLDDGAVVSFAGDESDLELKDAAGHTVYVDLSGLEEGFHGKVHVGVMGRIRSINFSQFLTQ